MTVDYGQRTGKTIYVPSSCKDSSASRITSAYFPQLRVQCSHPIGSISHGVTGLEVLSSGRCSAELSVWVNSIVIENDRLIELYMARRHCQMAFHVNMTFLPRMGRPFALIHYYNKKLSRLRSTNLYIMTKRLVRSGKRFLPGRRLRSSHSNVCR